MNFIFKKTGTKNIFLFLLLVGVAFLFWNSALLQEWFYNAVSISEEHVHKNELAIGLIFMLLNSASAMLAPLSSAPLVPGAILLWDNLTVFFLLWVGWNLGHSASYCVGRYAGYPIIKKIANFSKIEHYKEKLSSRLGFLIIFLFCLSMPAEVPGYVLGILRYPFWKYIIAVSVSELPFALITVYASNAFLANKPLAFTGWVFFGLFLVSIIFYFFHKKFKIQEIKK